MRRRPVPVPEPLSAVLRRLHEEATPGPWRHVEKGRVFNDHHLVCFVLGIVVAEVEANHEDHAVVPIATCRDPLCRVYAALRERLEARP
jgi:hypothetical protein